MASVISLDNEREIARIKALGHRDSVLAYHDVAIRESAARKEFVAALEGGMAETDPEQFEQLAETLSGLNDLSYDLNQMLIGRMVSMFVYDLGKRCDDAQ